jgi:predicted RNA-binding Zn-ribbon protein involved in translation (DUF1610 family)
MARIDVAVLNLLKYIRLSTGKGFKSESVLHSTENRYKTLLEVTQSKRSCPSCGHNCLVTNDAEKFDEVVYNHCLNCGYEFPENKHEFSENELQRVYFGEKRYRLRPESNHFWDKANRIVVIAIGGACIGAAIAQLPGAVLGGLSALGYGLYISFSDSDKATAKNL